MSGSGRTDETGRDPSPRPAPEGQAVAQESRASGGGSAAEGSPARDVAALLEWLEALVDNPESLAAVEPALRRRLRQAAGRVAFPDRAARKRFARSRRQAEERRRRERDGAALAGTSNRATKRALTFPAPPDDLVVSEANRRWLALQAQVPAVDEAADLLLEPRPCYVCKQLYREVHAHYDSMCPACAALNWEKRHASADLTGRAALVTGARVKIGFEIALKLLRAGARVVATSRFVCDAAERFAAQPDFADWSGRLRLRALDLRYTPSVEAFCEEQRAVEPRLDFLIHNACQTVRRPPEYYRELAGRETPARLPEAVAGLLAPAGASMAVAKPGAGVEAVAALSLVDLLDEEALAPLFPQGIRDGDGQALDLREKNSWRMDLHEVSTLELVEVQLVNAIAPFVLNAQLKPLMLAVPSRDKHIVNVSAMEGQFYRTFKTTRHPHTNMAKAALNMMTRTSAADFARDGIHMNSVDTGWVTDEDPFAKTVEKSIEQGFVPPLDSVDGAARVLDPIFSGITSGHHVFGQFLKDYRPTRW
jgi:NAD(P)-dependent dehydrogenase (short-subunit alcohol dehydrogenase family)